MAKVQVGLVKDVASGAMKGFKAGDKVVLVSNIDGKFYAIGDKCTHRGCSLLKGRLEGEVVTCPCHGSRFNVKTGAIVRGPAEEAELSFPVQIEGDGIWVEVQDLHH
jgi:3-phenylpropionate/trans-cinnamate dioxygenase ferredoxin subunit